MQLLMFDFVVSNVAMRATCFASCWHALRVSVVLQVTRLVAFFREKCSVAKVFALQFICCAIFTQSEEGTVDVFC